MKITLAELVEIKGGGTPSKKNPEYWDGALYTTIFLISGFQQQGDIAIDSHD